MNLGIISFPFLYVGIFPGVRHILAVAAPRADFPASGGACFFRWVWSESIGVEWGICLCLGLGSVIGIFVVSFF